MSLSRRENWPRYLAVFLRSRLRRPFAWGSHDCGLFAADCIIEMTGVDLAAGIRGTYTDQAGATAALAKATNGGGLLEFVEQVTAAHGIKEVPVRFARRGDLCLFPHPTLGNTMVIVGMEGHQVYGPGESGLGRYNLHPIYSATKTCGYCGHDNVMPWPPIALKLMNPKWSCVKCKLVQDRDPNAAHGVVAVSKPGVAKCWRI